MLHRTISNLLSSALRYTPPGKTISVQLRQNNVSTVLTVEDPGETIPPGYLERLFDRFYRASSTRREGSSSNAGLGLEITRSIVEVHHGRIWCTSADVLDSLPPGVSRAMRGRTKAVLTSQLAELRTDGDRP